MNSKADEILIRSIEKDGHYPKIDMFTEEAGELMQALNKMKRLQKYSGVILPPTKDSSIEYCLAYWNVCSEIADVKNVIIQLEKIFNADAVALSQERKIARLGENLNKS